jgi:predicted HTH domain antitoxin
MKIMTIQIPDEIIQNSEYTEKDLKQELALFLFEKKFLTLVQASKIAEMDFWQFQILMKDKNAYLHYDENDLETDLKNLDKLFTSSFP